MNVFRSLSASATVYWVPRLKQFCGPAIANRHAMKMEFKAVSNLNDISPEGSPKQYSQVTHVAVVDGKEKEYESQRRKNLEYIDGSTPWMGETPSLVRNLARAAIEFEERTGQELMDSGFNGYFEEIIAEKEEEKYRLQYESMEPTLRNRSFVARQVANRMLGCLGYLCPSCWLPQELDCMCGTVPSYSLKAAGVKFWLYMHPKEYLRKNNTGKLLWQVLGEDNAKICICGLDDHEDAMWRELKAAGQGSVWCVYPPRKATDTMVKHMAVPKRDDSDELSQAEGGSRVLHFILIDGTWSNSKAMVNRLTRQSLEIWPENEMICIGLSPVAPSVMHGLRPQPSKERTCTAAAASQLLQELSHRPELDSQSLREAAENIDSAIAGLLEVLSRRRVRTGRTLLRLGSGKNLGYSGDRSRPSFDD